MQSAPSHVPSPEPTSRSVAATLHHQPKQSRKFAAKYYANTIFHSSRENVLTNWLISLPSEHIELLQRVRLTGRLPRGATCVGRDGPSNALKDRVFRTLRYTGIDVKNRSFLTTLT